MRKATLLAASLLAVQASAAPKPNFIGIPEDTEPTKIAWVMTSGYTYVRSVGEHRMEGGLFRRGLGRVLAVEPGRREVSLYYEDDLHYSPDETTVTVDLVAGKTTYIYGAVEGDVRYFHVLLDHPADDALFDQINDVHRHGGQLCAVLRCVEH
jgi:hypothetical protein